MKNFKLIIEYDGTFLHGWQKQKEDRTVQEEIEKAIGIMTGKNIVVTASGRTDAGVHALGQTANFLCDTEITPEAFLRGLNSLTSEEIVIKECSLVDNDFHARYNVKSKTYMYRILNQPLPAAIFRQYAWFIPKKLDIDAMNAAILHIIGTHDFKAFEGVGSPRSSTVRTIIHAGLEQLEHGYISFEFKGNGFLRFMVRNITGTLVDIGLGKITPDDFMGILNSKDRSLAGITAPPQGLCLMKVEY